MSEGGNLPEGELPGGDLVPEQRARGFATTTLPYILFGAVLLCILCAVPALGYLGYTLYQDRQAASQAQVEGTRAVANASTADAQTILLQPPPDWPRQYVDTFDTDTGDWPIGTDDSDWGLLYQEVSGGEFVWRADSYNNTIWWAQLDSLGALTDCYVSVDVSKSEGVANQLSYGIVIRKTSDFDYYMFDMSDTGEFGFWLLENDEWSELIDWQASDAIRRDAVNKLAIRAEGSHFVLMINGQVVGEADDSTFTRGSVGMALNLYEAGQTATVAFDNFEVWAP